MGFPSPLRRRFSIVAYHLGDNFSQPVALVQIISIPPFLVDTLKTKKREPAYRLIDHSASRLSP